MPEAPPVIHPWFDSGFQAYLSNDTLITYAATIPQHSDTLGVTGFYAMCSDTPDFQIIVADASRFFGTDYTTESAGLNFNLFPLLSGSTYYIRMLAIYEDGYSEWSPILAANTTGVAQPINYETTFFRPFWNRKHGNVNDRIPRIQPQKF